MYVDTVYGFYGYSFLFLVECFSMIICCYECLIGMCFVFLYLHLFSAIERFHMGRRSRKTLIIIIIIIIIISSSSSSSSILIVTIRLQGQNLISTLPIIIQSDGVWTLNKLL